MAKMTLKEFKTALNNCDLPFDLWGYEGILCMLEGYHWKLSQINENEGYNALAKSEKNRARALHATLEEIGYYN